MSIRSLRNLPISTLVALGVFLLCLPGPAHALVTFDFEQYYYSHPGREVWDFSIIRPDSVFHIYYHTILEETPGASHADTIWHASSPDLLHWTTPVPVITSGYGEWDEAAVWAPHVFRDEVENNWTMAYTGVDNSMNQSIGLAWSADLEQWSLPLSSAVYRPDTLAYYWSPDLTWSSCRDPYLYRANNQWTMLTTAKSRHGAWPGWAHGIVHRAVSDNLVDWTDDGILFTNDGTNPYRDLESPVYLVRDGIHHLFFSETDVPGVSHMAATDPADWTLAQRIVLDFGGAAEIITVDGVDIFARYVYDRYLDTNDIFYVVRFDTMYFSGDTTPPSIPIPHPLDRVWASHDGQATQGNPIFGDNPVQRGEESVGHVGNFWFGSREYYQGPLSGRGTPGTKLTDSVTGELISHSFKLEGDLIQLLVGGGHYPQTCYVALVDALTDSILCSETGEDRELMTLREWDIRHWKGRQVRIEIVDQEDGVFGHINVDEIKELRDYAAVPGPVARTLTDLGPYPNPANPLTEIRFQLQHAGRVRLDVFDMRGRLLRKSGDHRLDAGEHSLSWDGMLADGRAAAGGTYLYRLTLDGRQASVGKLSLVK